MRDHRAQLDREKTKLAKMSAGLQVINITYDAVFQCIDQRENKLYDQVSTTQVKTSSVLQSQWLCSFCVRT